MNDDRFYGGRYKLLDVIGDGGMARVFRATDTRLDRTVAIKVLRQQFTGEPQFVERFKQEARLAAALAHPNIVGVYDVGEENGQYYMVMEYVPGDNLKRIIAREAPMPLGSVVSFMRQLAAALDYAHAHGVVHRDIKPENILVTDKREVKVGDFGIAQALAGTALTATGTVLGSVSYFSPEQASGLPATAESDLYSAGMVLFEMLTGHVPFSGPNPVAVAMAQVNDPPALPTNFVPELPRAVEAVVLKAIAKEPSQRYHSGYELMAALTAAAKPAPAPPAAVETEVPRARRAAPVVETAAVASTLVAGPQVPAVAPQRRGGRGNGGAIAALITTAILLLAAVLIYHTFSGNDTASSSAKLTVTPTVVATAPGVKPTRAPVVAPTLGRQPAATSTIPPLTSTPQANQVPIPSETPVATDTALDTATAADTYTPASTATTALPNQTPTALAGSPTAGGGTPTAGTVTPSVGSETPVPGSSHGATIDLVTASGVNLGKHFAPEGATTVFTAGTLTVYAVAEIHDKAKGDVVKFIWQYPDGSLFALEIPEVTSTAGNVTAYVEITPRGPGSYAVSTAINGHDLASVAFTVAANGSTAGATVPQGSANATAGTPGLLATTPTPPASPALQQTITPVALQSASPGSAETATAVAVAPALAATEGVQVTPSASAIGSTPTIATAGTAAPVLSETTETSITAALPTDTPAGQ